MNELYYNIRQQKKYKYNELEQENTNHVFRINEFYNLYDVYIKSELGQNTIKGLDKQIYLQKNLISSRILNHWESKKIINCHRDSSQGWRKFSILDMFWICLVLQLRRFGIPLSIIRNVGIDLGLLEAHSNQYRKYIVHYYLSLAEIINNDLIYLLVFDNGEADILCYSEYRETIELVGMNNHLIIILNDMIDQSSDLSKLNPTMYRTERLTKEEFELIDTIRTNEYKSVQIKTENGKIKNIETKKNYDPKTQIGKIIKQNNYSNILLKIQNNEVVCIEETLKRKFSKQ